MPAKRSDLTPHQLLGQRFYEEVCNQVDSSPYSDEITILSKKRSHGWPCILPGYEDPFGQTMVAPGVEIAVVRECSPHSYLIATLAFDKDKLGVMGGGQGIFNFASNRVRTDRVFKITPHINDQGLTRFQIDGIGDHSLKYVVDLALRPLLSQQGSPHPHALSRASV